MLHLNEPSAVQPTISSAASAKTAGPSGEPRPPLTPVQKARRRVYRQMLKAIKAYNLIEAGDKIMVAVSGGKDSYTLLDLLETCRKRSPVPFEIVAVHLDQQQPGYDGRPLKAWLTNFGVPFEIQSKDTYSVVMELTREGGTYCAPCSRLRRGILYDTAERLGCNKIALGHHRDDALETLMMNLFFAGKLQGMPAKYATDDGRFEVIRPLIECAEADIKLHAAEAAYPILPCNLCGSQDGLQRAQMTTLIDNLEARIPNVRVVMLAAMKNIRPTHLLDVGLIDALTTGDVSQLGADKLPKVRGQRSPDAEAGTDEDLLGGGCGGTAGVTKMAPLVQIKG
jgi:tRNA 2-thiocytidine biosynthesis protein TtcA